MRGLCEFGRSRPCLITLAPVLFEVDELLYPPSVLIRRRK